MRGAFASERLAMRPFVAADAEPLHAGYGDPDLMRWWSTPPHADVEETRTYLVGDDEDDGDGDGDGDDDGDGEEPGADHWQGWAVTLDGEPIGTLSAGWRRAGVFEIGYLLVRRHWGHGYGREMVARLVELLVEEERARRLYADVDPDNHASVALLQGLGFQLEGRLRASWDSHIGIRDSLILGLLADEWRAGPPAPSPDSGAKARAMLVAPIGLVGMGLAVFGLALALIPRVPRAVAAVVLVVALAQLLAAAALRRRCWEPS